MARFTHEDANKRKKWSMAAYGSWQLANDGAATNGGGIVGDVSLNITAEPTVVYDHGTTTFVDLIDSSDLTGWTNDNQLSADAGNEEAGTDADGSTDGDAVYFGHTIPFCEISFDLNPVGVNAAKAWRWEYYNGTQWNIIPAASFFDNTDLANQDGEQSFEQDGAVSFIPPSDWATVAITGSGLPVTIFWIRARVVAAQITTTPITNGVEPKIVTPLDGFTCPHGGTITGIRVIDGKPGTDRSDASLKFIFMNFTTGAHSGELTWVLAQRQDAFTGLTLAVNQDDELGVLVTGEDIRNKDPHEVLLELQVSG